MLVSLHQRRKRLFDLWGANITQSLLCTFAPVGARLQSHISFDIATIALVGLLAHLSQEPTSLTDDLF